MMLIHAVPDVLHQFLSPPAIRGRDEYCVSLENRARLTMESPPINPLRVGPDFRLNEDQCRRVIEAVIPSGGDRVSQAAGKQNRLAAGFDRFPRWKFR
jgi:hypothetical protein